MVSIKDEMKKSIKAKQNVFKPMNRVNKFSLRYDMLNDNYYGQVRARLTDIYSKAADIRLDRQLDLTNNIYKTIVKKISRVYSFGFSRVFSSDDTQAMYEDLNINKMMKEANIFTNAFNDMIIQVSWNYKENKPRLIFRYPHKTRVTLDEYDNPKEVEYFVSVVDDKKEKWAYWSESEHYYKVYDGDKVAIEYPEGNEDGVNGYGVLPFVFMQKGYRDGYFFDQYSGDDLVAITLDNAVYNTFKNYLIKWQSFKQLVVTGANIGELSGQLLDPSTALTVDGEDAKVDILDLQTNLTQLDEVLSTAANNVAINYNISANQFRMTGAVSSGFALKMENKALDEFTIEQQSDFKQYEYELFNMIRNIVLVENGTDIGEFNIEFTKPHYQESKSTELDAIVKEIDLGLRSPVEILANKLDITIEEAQVKLDENLALRNKIYNKVDSAPSLDMDTTAQALGI